MPNAGSCHVLVMSLAFIFLMTASQIFTITLVFIEGLRFKEFNFATIGIACILIVYGTFAAVILFIPPMIRIIGPKYAMLMGSMTYIIFMLSQLFPFAPGVFITSVLVGVGSALLWTGHGNYLVRNSTERNISSHCALFWTTSQISTFLGSAFVYFRFFDTNVVDEKTRLNIIWLLFGLCCMSSIIFLMLPKSVHEDLLSVSWKDQPSCLQMMFGMGRMIKSGHILLLYIPCFLLGLNSVFLGMSYGTVVGHTMLLERPKQLAPMTGIFIGLGEVIGAGSLLIFGSSSEKTRRTVIFIFGCIMFILALLLIFVNLPNESPFHDTDDESIIESSAILVIGSSFMMGIADACFNIQIMAHLSLNYPKNSASAFAVMRFFQAIGSLVAVACATFVVLYGAVLILIGVTIFTTTSFIVSERDDVDEDKIFIYDDKTKRDGLISRSTGGPSPKPSPKPSPGPSTQTNIPLPVPLTTTSNFSGRSFPQIGSFPFKESEPLQPPSQSLQLTKESTSEILKETLYDLHPEPSPKNSQTPSGKQSSTRPPMQPKPPSLEQFAPSQSLQLSQEPSSKIPRNTIEPSASPLAPPTPSLLSEEKTEILDQKSSEPKSKLSFFRKLLGSSDESSKRSILHSISTIKEEKASEPSSILTPIVEEQHIDGAEPLIPQENERTDNDEKLESDPPIEADLSAFKPSSMEQHSTSSKIINLQEAPPTQKPIEIDETDIFEFGPNRTLTETKIADAEDFKTETITGMGDVATLECEQGDIPVEIEKTISVQKKTSILDQEKDFISLKITPVYEEIPIFPKEQKASISHSEDAPVSPRVQEQPSISQSEDAPILPRVQRKMRKKSFKSNISESEEASESEGSRPKRRTNSRKKYKSKSEGKQLESEDSNKTESTASTSKPHKILPKKRGMFKRLMSEPEKLPQKSSNEMGNALLAPRTLTRKQTKKRKASSSRTLGNSEESESLLTRDEEKSDPGGSKMLHKRSLRRNVEAKEMKDSARRKLSKLT